MENFVDRVATLHVFIAREKDVVTAQVWTFVTAAIQHTVWAAMRLALSIFYIIVMIVAQCTVDSVELMPVAKTWKMHALPAWK